MRVPEEKFASETTRHFFTGVSIDAKIETTGLTGGAQSFTRVTFVTDGTAQLEGGIAEIEIRGDQEMQALTQALRFAADILEAHVR